MKNSITLQKEGLRAAIQLESAKLNKETKLLSGVRVLYYDGEGTTYNHGYWGEFTLNDEVFTDFINNFNNKFWGTDLYLNLNHYGGESFGWVQSIQKNPENPKELTLDIELTSEGMKLILEKAYRYFSAEFYIGQVKNEETGSVVNNVFTGIALTNDPFMQKAEIPKKLSKKTQGETMNKDELIKKLSTEHGVDVISLQSSVKSLETEKLELSTQLSTAITAKAKVDAELVELKKESREKGVSDLFDYALSNGKVTKAQEVMLKSYINTFEDLEAAKVELEKMPKVVDLGGEVGTGESSTDDEKGKDTNSYTYQLDKKTKEIMKDEGITYLEALDKAKPIVLKERAKNK